MKKILLALSLLALAFSSAQAYDPSGEIKILPTKNLESCPMGKSKTVEVIIYNPKCCPANITDITLSDDVNFDLNRSFGDIPCGDASLIDMRGYQYCTVGLTFKPTTTSGTFSTDIQVTDRDTGVHSVTVDGNVKTCCPRKHKRRKVCASDTNETINYLANLNLVSPVPSTHVYVDDKTLVFHEYSEDLAVIALDAPVDFLSRLTFDVNQTTGLFMLKLLGDNGMYCIPNIKRTNRYGFMFPAGKALNKLNFITNSVAYSGVVSNLSLIEISDLNQTSTQESDATCGDDLHSFCNIDLHKVCDRDHKRDSHKTCDRDHKRDSHKTCDRDHKRDSHKTCDRDDKRDSHKTCDRR